MIAADHSIHVAMNLMNIGRVLSDKLRRQVMRKYYHAGSRAVACKQRPRITFAIAHKALIRLHFGNNRRSDSLHAIFATEHIGML
ncbi:hypothetical protein SDC9_199640 [bioreactor metagenome]|uniref:Uncharacterized protein n=1 Tax=bioreactor metagenome TaxID=1076179 RepID=A0A645IL08_9ZZZZ